MKILSICVGEVSTNCYIVYDENTMDAVVIDPGDDAASILDTIRQEHLNLKYVMLTHGHYDHILGAHDILTETGAQYVVPGGDLWLLKKEEVPMMYHDTYVEDAPDIVAAEGTELSFGSLTACYMNTPGHTPGSSVIRIADCLFAGDTLFKHDCGRCDLTGGDYSQMLQSLKRLYELEGDYRVLPGHDEFSTLAEERQKNPYMKEGVEVLVQWLGHSCFKVTHQLCSVVFDPFEPGSIPGLADVHENADMVLCSHGHFDHNYAEAVHIVKHAKPEFFKVTKINVSHDDKNGTLRGFSDIYLIEMNGYRIAHFGDIGCELTEEQAALLADLDVAFVPVGGYYTIDAGQAADLVKRLNPMVTIPMHYSSDHFGFDEIGTVEKFTQLFDTSMIHKIDSDTIAVRKDMEHQVIVPTYGKGQI